MKFDPEAKKVCSRSSTRCPIRGIEHADQLFEGQQLIAQVVKVTPNYLLIEIIPGVLAMVPRASSTRRSSTAPAKKSRSRS